MDQYLLKECGMCKVEDDETDSDIHIYPKDCDNMDSHIEITDLPEYLIEECECYYSCPEGTRDAVMDTLELLGVKREE